jgi:integrase/recombinase XerD
MIADRTCLPPGIWPDADRAAWNRACRRGSLLDDVTPAARWRQTTRHVVEKGYGTWLQWLALHCPDALPVLPAERVTPERIAAYLEDLQAHNAPWTVHMRILHIARMLVVMTGQPTPEWLRTLLVRLHRARQSVRDDRARLVPARSLVELGFDLMARAERQTNDAEWQRALFYRDGLMLVMLCASCLQLSNLAAIRTGKHLQQRGHEYWLTFEASEMKGRRAHELPLPTALKPAIERYLAVWRPVLLAQRQRQHKAPHSDADRLWLGRYGALVPAKRINEIVNRITRRGLGRAINPHLVRKIALTELAIHDPAHVGIAQRLLAHASYETTQNAYNLARTLDAAHLLSSNLVAAAR